MILEGFHSDLVSLASVALRTVAIYFAVLLLLRWAGKRELGQSTPFDFVVLLLIANAVQNAMVGSDNTVVGGILSATSILAANKLVDWVCLRVPAFRRRLLGTPTLLIHNGQLLKENLRREGVLEEEVLGAVREHGLAHLRDVKAAVLELDGSISVIPFDAAGSPVGLPAETAHAPRHAPTS